jgi:hypothetical protein
MPESHQEAFNKLAEHRGFPSIYSKKGTFTEEDMIEFANSIQPKYTVTKTSLDGFLKKK